MRLCGLLMLVVLGLTACASSMTLAPAGFDLDGAWTLLPSLSDDPPDATDILREQERELIRGRRVDSTASELFLTRDFPVLASRSLEIEQGVESMGIRYDDGSYRDITWGMREQHSWTVRSGWDQGVLVIRSARGGISAVERMSLVNNGTRLVVEIRIKMGRGGFSATRVFERS